MMAQESTKRAQTPPSKPNNTTTDLSTEGLEQPGSPNLRDCWIQKEPEVEAEQPNKHETFQTFAGFLGRALP